MVYKPSYNWGAPSCGAFVNQLRYRTGASHSMGLRMGSWESEMEGSPSVQSTKGSLGLYWYLDSSLKWVCLIGIPTVLVVFMGIMYLDGPWS